MSQPTGMVPQNIFDNNDIIILLVLVLEWFLSFICTQASLIEYQPAHAKLSRVREGEVEVQGTSPRKKAVGIYAGAVEDVGARGGAGTRRMEVVEAALNAPS